MRTHDIVIRRLEARGLGYVCFHGGVPSEKRPALVERFRDDPACRVFLSTDAGGVGLNLQHAATVVNMDLPWNPAVLEQRIGRVHRMGQARPVRVDQLRVQGHDRGGHAVGAGVQEVACRPAFSTAAAARSCSAARASPAS